MAPRFQGSGINNSYPLSALAGFMNSQQIVFVDESVNATQGVSTAQQTWDVNDGQMSQWITAILGYSIANGFSISRALPAQHPQFPWLWGSGVDGSGLGPRGQSNSVALYKRWRTKIHYESPPYDIFPDNQIQGEYQRFLTLVDVQSDSQIYQRRQGCFAMSPNAPGLDGNAALIPESYGASQIVTRIAYNYLWVQVPDAGLYTNGGFGALNAVEQNLLSAVGTVNNATFFGKPAGTLLFDSYKPIPHVLPLAPSLVYKGGVNGKVPRSWDVQLRFIYFRPPSGEVAIGQPNSPGPGGTEGHNLVPHPTNGKWYLAYLRGAESAPNAYSNSQFWRYQPSSFPQIFFMNPVPQIPNPVGPPGPGPNFGVNPFFPKV